jgi:hypothetical protein
VNWQYPVAAPIFTGLVAQMVREDAEAEGGRPKAFDTLLRFSDAGACARKMAFNAMGIAESDPMDAGGHWVTFLGKLVHERLQQAVEVRFPGANFETPASLVGFGLDSSGHSDVDVDGEIVDAYLKATAFGEWDGGRVLYELKTIGGYGFNKAIGLDKRKRQLNTPGGPRHTAVLQGGLNALANDCETVIIGYLAMESVSIQLAQDAGMRPMDRFCVEWHIPRDVWEPMARAEMDRQNALFEYVTEGLLPPGEAVGDDGELISLNPHDKKIQWQCVYCSHRHNCEGSW